MMIAVSDYVDIEKYIDKIKNDIYMKKSKSIYILASGRKIPYAEEITSAVFNQHSDVLMEPELMQYRRTGKYRSSDAVTYLLRRKDI